MLALNDPSETIARRSAAIGFGVFMGIFPVWGYQLILGLSICHYLKLNKVLFTISAHISIPPMIPLILYLSYLIGGMLVGGQQVLDFSKSDLTIESLANNFFQYLVGAVILSIFAGVLAFYISIIFYKHLAKTSFKQVK